MRVGLCIAGLGALGIVVLAAGTPAPARAQTDDERARTHFESGRSYYEQAQYEDAAREFQESFDLSARPELLLNISQAQERALHYDDAIGAARHYLELLPTADNKKTVEERIASLTELKQRFEEGGPAPLAPPGDSSTLTPMGDSPTGGATTPATPGTKPTTPPPTAAAAGVTTPGPDLTQAPESERENKYTIPAIILMGAGGAALVGALVTGVIAHADYNSLERQCRGKICPASAQDELDEGKTLSVVSTVLTVVGVLAAGAGGALLFVGTREAEETPPAAGHVSLGPGVTPLSVSGTISF
jgi:tetratricopeptide (TPR) repeat protein